MFVDSSRVMWHPDLFDSETGKYIGAMHDNQCDGRRKLENEVRASIMLSKCRKCRGQARCILLALKDSLQTFKEGKPHLSFANINGRFDFRETMEETGKTTIAGMPVQEYIYR